MGILKGMMIGLGVPLRMVKWIMACVSAVSYLMLVNGLPMPPFKAKKRLRQGDPISPYLFVMAIEYLPRRLNGLKDNSNLKFHLKCSKIATVWLLFTDYLLIFCKGDSSSILTVKEKLDTFSKA